MFNQRRLERLTRQVILIIYGQLNDYKSKVMETSIIGKTKPCLYV